METRIIFKNSVKVIFMAMAMLAMSYGLESCDSNAIRVVDEMETYIGLDDMEVFEYDKK